MMMEQEQQWGRQLLEWKKGRMGEKGQRNWMDIGKQRSGRSNKVNIKLAPAAFTCFFECFHSGHEN